MPIRQTDLYAAARRRGRPLYDSIVEASAAHATTAFLCHSHKDQELVKGLVQTFQEARLDVYVDWEDSAMPETPDRTTASRIQEKIRSLNLFLFLATSNSMSSRWCPWEIGFADGVKSQNSIMVIPTTDGYTTHGAEYLELYRRIDYSDKGFLGTREPMNYRNGSLLSNLWR